MIRIVQPADAAAIADIYRPYVQDSVVSFELIAPDAADMQSRIAAILPHTPWLVYEHQGAVAGYAYASPHRERPAYQWTREVSVYVHPQHRRCRIAHQLYAALIAILRAQGYTNLLAGITLPNDPSVRFHESMGFAPVGIYHRIGYKMGNYHDVGWWELFIADPQQPPAPPVPFALLRQSYPI